MAGHPHPRTRGHQGRHPTMVALGSLTNPPVPLALLEQMEKQDWLEGWKLFITCSMRQWNNVKVWNVAMMCTLTTLDSVLFNKTHISWSFPGSSSLVPIPLVHIAWMVSLIFLQCSIFKVEGAVDFVVQTFLASVVGPKCKGALFSWIHFEKLCIWPLIPVGQGLMRLWMTCTADSYEWNPVASLLPKRSSLADIDFSLLTEFCLQMRPREDRANDLTKISGIFYASIGLSELKWHQPARQIWYLFSSD